MAVKNAEKTVETVETVNEWEIMKTIFLPRARKHEKKTAFVCINGRTFRVPKGKSVEVPLPVYEALTLAQQAHEDELLMCEEIPNEVSVE